MLMLIHTSLLLLRLHSAVDSVARDTIRQPEVVITAMPWQWDVRSETQSKLTFTRAQLASLAPSQARDVLSLVPGVFVRDYGGATALQTVSLRGGSSSQSLVLIDGARFSSAQNGSADISMIPMRYVSAVDVTRGGASALYGANALSGVVAANTAYPVIACPPFADKDDYQVNIHSTLQMPSGVPSACILRPDNVAGFCKRIFKMV